MWRTRRDTGLLPPASLHFVRTLGFAMSTRAPSPATAKPLRAGTMNCGCSTADPVAQTTGSSFPSPGNFPEYCSNPHKNPEASPCPTKILLLETPALRGTSPYRSFGQLGIPRESEIERQAPD